MLERPYVGIDPGSTGALCLDWANRLSIWKVPTLQDAPAGTAVDDDELLAIARAIASLDPVVAVLEHVWGIAGQGAGSAFTFGDTNGAIRLALKSAGVPIKLAAPSRWRNRLRVHGDKSQSIAAALRFYPQQPELFTPARRVLTLRQAEGNAEAALIARYAKVTYATDKPA